MAENEATHHDPKTLSAAEVQSLADRLLNRGISQLSDLPPEAKADLRLASACLRALVAHRAADDVVHVNVWRS